MSNVRSGDFSRLELFIAMKATRIVLRLVPTKFEG
jgi:hypothetical protein